MIKFKLQIYTLNYDLKNKKMLNIVLFNLILQNFRFNDSKLRIIR